MKQIDLIYRADGTKGAKDGGAIRMACKATCEKVDYGITGISSTIIGIDYLGRKFCDSCPADCIVEVIGGNPAVYQAEVTAW